MVRSETMEQSRQEGRIEERRVDILAWLARRFEQEPPEHLANTVQACEDLPLLRAWFDLALEAGSLDDFRQQAGL